MWLQAYGFSKTLLCNGRCGSFVFPPEFSPSYVRSLGQSVHVPPYNSLCMQVEYEGQSVTKGRMKSGTYISLVVVVKRHSEFTAKWIFPVGVSNLVCLLCALLCG